MRAFCIAALLLVLEACGRSDAEDAVASKLSDPEVARFQSVRRHGDAVCGEVKEGGEKTGKYRRFVYFRNVASLAPVSTYSAADIAAFEATCRIISGRGNGLDQEVCKRAADARRTREEAEAFDTLWQRTCR